MTYKVIIVRETTGSGIDDKIEKAFNLRSRDGYVLVTAYPQQVSTSDCCNQNQSAVGAVLVFAKQ